MTAEAKRQKRTLVPVDAVLDVTGDDEPPNKSEVPKGYTGRHALNVRHEYTWCSSCGSYTSGGRMRKLKGFCVGHPESGFSATRKDRLNRGLDPVSGETLPGETRKIRVTDLVQRRRDRSTAVVQGAGGPRTTTLLECGDADHG